MQFEAPGRSVRARGWDAIDDVDAAAAGHLAASARSGQ